MHIRNMSRHGRGRLLGARWSCACLVLLLLVGMPLTLQARSWRIVDFHSSIAVAEDGSALVIEKINLEFTGQFNGIYRTIPVEYPGPGGTNYSLFLTVRSVTDAADNPLRYESTTKGGYRKLKIYVPGAVDNTRLVQITYSVKNAVRFFDDHSELYWNVTGNDWPVPIAAASAMVLFPPSVSGMRVQAFTGAYGSTSREAIARVEGSNAVFETLQPLPMRGGLTVDVFVPPGLLHQPNALTRTWWFISSNQTLLLPLITFAVMYTLWHFKGRDPDPGLSVAPRYEPPKNLTPAEVGTLVDDRVDPRDITSTLVDLAVRGYIRIEDTSHKVLMFTTHDYNLHLLKKEPAWEPSLSSWERTMLDQIFQGGEVTSISSLRNRFYTAIPAITSGIKQSLKDKNMYSLDPDRAHAYGAGAGLGIAALVGILQKSGTFDFFASGWLTAVCVVAAVAIIIFFSRILSAKTFAGARTTVGIKGFQEFMNRVDADRLQRMPPDTFEKYLPYAMALGVEHHWAQAFEGILHQPPAWYTSAGGGNQMFSPILFTSDIQHVTNTASDVMTAAPRSSSGGSGFGGGGGGGFSGGGFGGGGGGAF